MPFAVALLVALQSAPHVAPAPPPQSAAKAAPKPAVVAPSKPKVLSPSDLEAIVRGAVARGDAKLPRGAKLSAVRSTAVATPPGAYASVTIDVTPPARKAGAVTTTGVLAFHRDAKPGHDDVVARIPVALDLDVSPDAMAYDVEKGSPMVLVVVRGLVEVSAPCVTSAPGDIGDVVQVLLRPSGRALRAKIVAKDRAVAVEDGR